MPRRKPLEWIAVDGGFLPDCVDCVLHMAAPGFTEAVYGVGIEHAGGALAVAKVALGAYHANRHREVSAMENDGY